MDLEHDHRLPAVGRPDRARHLAFDLAERLAGPRATVAAWLAALQSLGGRVWQTVGPWAVAQPMWKFATRSIRRRILAANLVGFAILFLGLMVLSQSNRWLLDAKLDSLNIQARMVAVAIASSSRVGSGAFTLDLGASDADRGLSDNDMFTSMALAIAPEKVAPVLSRLIPYGEARARIYGLDGFLIHDSATRLTRGQIATRKEQDSRVEDGTEKVRNAWTRFMAWFVRSELPVYRDVGSEKGTVYPEVAQALRGQTTRMLLFNALGQQMVAVAQPIQILDNVQGVVLLSSRPGDIDELIWRQRRAMMVLLTLALLTTAFASWLLGRTIAGPMRRLSEAAEHVSHSINARRELPDFPGRRDEVGLMARAFREMTASLYRRIEASDRFAQDVAHELRNPVAAASGTAQSLEYAKSEEQRAELVRQIQGEMKRLNRLIIDVAKVSRLDGELALQETEPVDMAEIAAGIVGVLADVHRDSGRRIEISPPLGPHLRGLYMVDGHAGRLSQVMTNLIDNALSFSPPTGVVSVSLARDGTFVVVRVDDQGPGIPPDGLEEIFKRFYSDRPQSDQIAGKNSGLGLSITREIVLAHGGSIVAENRMAEPGERVGTGEQPELAERRIAGVAGARFVVRLPVFAGPGANP